MHDCITKEWVIYASSDCGNGLEFHAKPTLRNIMIANLINSNDYSISTVMPYTLAVTLFAFFSSLHYSATIAPLYCVPNIIANHPTNFLSPQSNLIRKDAALLSQKVQKESFSR